MKRKGCMTELRQWRQSASGFTLTELMTASAISLILGGMLVSFLTGVLGSWHKTSSRDEAYTEARAALQLLERELDSSVMWVGTKSELLTGLNVPSGNADESLGFLCKVKISAQPVNENQSNLCAVAYYLSPTSAEADAPQALYRTLLSSQNTFKALTQDEALFPTQLSWSSSNSEVVAQNVIDFKVKVLDADFQAIDMTIQPPPNPAPVPSFIEVSVEVIGTQSAKRYFQRGINDEARKRIKEQEGREFVLRHRL